MHPARIPSRLRSLHALSRVLLGGLTVIVGVAGLAVLPYPLWLMTRACWDSIDWAETLDQPLNGPLLILAAVGAGWAVWGWLLYATAADIAAALQGRAPLRLPVPLHRAVTAAAGLLGALLQPAAAAAATTPASTAAVQADDAAASPVTTAAPVMIETPASAAAPVTVETPAPQPVIYVVRRGDALSRIARNELGDANRWPEIYTLNRGTRFTDVGGTLTNPDVIYPGWRLKMPLPAVTPPPATTVQPPASTGSAPPAATAPPTPAPSMSAPSTVASPTPSVPSSAAPATAASSQRLTDLLPWLALILTPVVAVLLRRRRHPGTRPARARTPKSRTAPAEPVAAATAAPGDRPEAAAAPEARTPAERHEIARRLVDDPATRVIIPRATLQHLRPDQTAPSDAAALTVTTTVDEAIIAVEAEMLRRARLVAEHDADDYADIRDVEDLTPIVLVTQADPEQRTRIAATVEPAGQYDIQAVIVDAPRPTTLSWQSARVPERAPAPADAARRQVPTESTPADADEPASEMVRVQVIGDVRVLDRRGQPVPGLRGRAKDLLTYLALHRAGAELSDIMEALWPDAT
ncbi:hypothetical protein ACFY3L_51485, partial [Dactylosporangium sp. NPDC000521]